MSWGYVSITVSYTFGVSGCSTTPATPMLTVGKTSNSQSLPNVPSPMAILTSLTGGSSKPK